MRQTIIATLLVVASVSSWAADAETSTGGYQNGRAWLSWSHETRLGFVMGFVEMHMVPACHGQAFPIWTKGDVTYGEMVKSIQSFFQEPANARLPIAEAFSVVAMKFNGESRERIDEYTTGLRKRYAEMK